MIKIGNEVIAQNTFPDKTLLVKFNPYTVNTFGSVTIQWIYESDSELFTLICLKRHLDQAFPNKSIELELRYIPHARMDRTKSTEDVFTLKYFCEVINSLHFAEVHVLDAHSNVSLALLNNVTSIPVGTYIRNATVFSAAEALFFPDEGAMKRYADESTLPYAFGMKKRDWTTGQILGLDIMNADVIKDKHVLIVDDICSRGGTFYHSAKALKAAGAKEVDLYITHCENTIALGQIFDRELINNIYTTHSLIHTPEVAERVIYV